MNGNLFRILVIALLIVVAFLFSGCTREDAAVSEGGSAPLFELMDAGGNNWSLADLKGSVVLVNFWASWCPPCKEEIPSLQRLFEKTAKNPGIVILSIVYKDDPFQAYAYARSANVGYPILKDPDGSAATAYGLTGVPETYIIDKRGILRKKVIGPMDFDTPQVTDYLERLAKE